MSDEEYEEYEISVKHTEELVTAAQVILTANLTDRQKLGIIILSLTGPDWLPKDVKQMMDILEAPDLKRVK